MTAILSTRPTDLAAQEFAAACALLTAARRSQSVKDTADARLRVELCRARLDAVLDDWNAGRAALV